MSSVSCCTICNSISLFPSRPIPHHPTSSHLSHHSYIFISLGFTMPAHRIRQTVGRFALQPLNRPHRRPSEHIFQTACGIIAPE
nr:MAG TPA: hypothetical protein [Caudoviricetes sp.]